VSNAIFQSLDATLHAAFAANGMADTGTLAPKAGGEPVPGVKCYVDRDVAALAMRGLEVRKGAALVTLLRQGVTDAPRVGDVITVGGDSLRVVELLDEDEGAWRLGVSL
jgi:hypothetical protein